MEDFTKEQDMHAPGFAGSPTDGRHPSQDAPGFTPEGEGSAGSTGDGTGTEDGGTAAPKGGRHFHFSFGLAVIIGGIVWALVELWLSVSRLF